MYMYITYRHKLLAWTTLVDKTSSLHDETYARRKTIFSALNLPYRQQLWNEMISQTNKTTAIHILAFSKFLLNASLILGQSCIAYSQSKLVQSEVN